MRKLKIGFIGLGLIGGSIAKAIKKAFPEHELIIYNRSESARTLSLSDGVADFVTDKVDKSFSECDYIFLCTPVEHNITYLDLLRDIIKPDCIITDVGSVKGNIHRAISEKNMEANFIGGHPMAGSEKTGYENSSALILENAYYVITPTDAVSKERINEFYTLVESMKAMPVVINYEEHDYSVAAISHVPHLIASGLVNLVKDNDSTNETMKLLAAGGFKDITRIASSSPEMWQQICLENKDNIVKLLEKYIYSLEEIKAAIVESNPDYVYKLIEKSRDYRNSFEDRKSGLVSKSYRLYCDIEDESGAISSLATLLANKHISIKNIGIIHNREHQEGVLRIEFYTQEAVDNAVELLKKAGYTIYL